jgi:hypothetical protein
LNAALSNFTLIFRFSEQTTAHTSIRFLLNPFGSSLVFSQPVDHLRSHFIDPELRRANSFDAFMADRQSQLLKSIEDAMGKSSYMGDLREEGEDYEPDQAKVEAALTIAAA